jgi:hypothetical protein
LLVFHPWTPAKSHPCLWRFASCRSLLPELPHSNQDWFWDGLLVILNLAGLSWCLRHSYLDGQPVGPLKKIFRLRRVLPLMFAWTTINWSLFFWAIVLRAYPKTPAAR